MPQEGNNLSETFTPPEKLGAGQRDEAAAAPLPHPLSLAEIHQATEKLRNQSLSPNERNTLRNRINATYEIPEEETDPQLQDEACLLELRMNLTAMQLSDQARGNPQFWTQEAIEQSVSNLRQQLIDEANSSAREEPEEQTKIPEQQEPQNEKSQFLNFISQRIRHGMIDFAPGGIPVEKQLHDAIVLYYRPEAAKEKGIADTPSDDRSSELPPFDEDQQYYLDSLLERTIMADDHSSTLPPEPSMHNVVRKLNRAMKNGTHYDPEFVWGFRSQRPPARNPRP